MSSRKTQRVTSFFIHLPIEIVWSDLLFWVLSLSAPSRVAPGYGANGRQVGCETGHSFALMTDTECVLFYGIRILDRGGCWPNDLTMDMIDGCRGFPTSFEIGNLIFCMLLVINSSLAVFIAVHVLNLCFLVLDYICDVFISTAREIGQWVKEKTGGRGVGPILFLRYDAGKSGSLL